MLRLTTAALMITTATATDCTSALCCSAIKQNNCIGNTHSGTAAAPVLGSAQANYACTDGAAKHLIAAAATTSCGDIGTACTDDICCATHTVTAGCAAGEYLVVGTGTSDEACTACPTGKWQAASADRAAAVTADVCEDHLTTCGTAGQGLTGGSATADKTCAACPAGKYAAASDDSCLDCAAGNDVNDATPAAVTTAGVTCDTCTVDTDYDHDSDSSTACQTATANTAGCDAGQYLVVATTTSQDTCTACPDGKWQAASADRAAAVTAGECEAQSATVCNQAGQGNNVASALTTAGATLEVVCTACPAGKYAATSDDSCLDCAAGNDVNDATPAAVTTAGVTCDTCTVGTDWDHDGDSSTACQAVSTSPPTACPAGKGLVAATATADAACVWCTSDGGTGGVATYKTATDGSACLDQATPTCGTAGEGRTTGGPGTAVICAACPAGKFALAASDTCTAHTVCDAGEATTPGTPSADATCAACAAGKTSTAGGACEDITGYCTNVVDVAARGDATVASGTAIAEFACAAGEYVAGNVQSAVVATVAAGCHEDAGVADGTCTLNAHTTARAAVDAVTATATVYGVAAVTAVTPTCTETGCSYSAGAGAAASDAVCPAPDPVTADTAQLSGAAAAAPALAVAALVAALV